MNKKLYIILFITLFTLIGCSKQNNNIFTFQESLDIFNKQINIFLDKYSNIILSTGNFGQDFQINIDSIDKDIDLNLYLSSKISFDFFNKDYFTNINYNINLLDKIKNQKVSSTWDFNYSNIDYIPYIKINKFDLDMGTGNIESIFIQALLSWIIDKWLMIDIQDQKNLIQKYVDINYIIKDISQIINCNIFNQLSKDIYPTKDKYNISLDAQTIQKCIDIKYYNYTWVVFEWVLYGQSNNDTILEIKKLSLPNNPNLIINWQLNYKTISININDIITKQTTSISIEYSTNKDKISIQDPNNQYNFNIKSDKDQLYLDWNALFITNNFNKLPIKFDIKSNLILQKTWYLDIYSPQNYIIMSQLLWDQFSLKTIIWQ